MNITEEITEAAWKFYNSHSHDTGLSLIGIESVMCIGAGIGMRHSDKIWCEGLKKSSGGDGRGVYERFCKNTLQTPHWEWLTNEQRQAWSEITKSSEETDEHDEFGRRITGGSEQTG